MSDHPIPSSLSDTRRCPRGRRCESCGAEPGMGSRIARTLVVVRRVPLPAVDGAACSGVACFTMCAPCAGSGLSPNITPATGARVVAQHVMHLAGLTAR